VNAAKTSLLGGGGVDGAIHKAAGPKLLESCRKLGGCRTGEAKITKAYNLPSKYVIHTVGPKDKNPTDLAQCYKSSLDLMKLNKLRTIAFPSIATGYYGFPLKEAVRIALSTVKSWLSKGDNASHIDRVIFCALDKETHSAYTTAWLNSVGPARQAASRS
jgi:O-acetyl-ADP-ribose deacetylase (regulator of RNase III)